MSTKKSTLLVVGTGSKRDKYSDKWNGIVQRRRCMDGCTYVFGELVEGKGTCMQVRAHASKGVEDKVM